MDFNPLTYKTACFSGLKPIELSSFYDFIRYYQLFQNFQVIGIVQGYYGVINE